MTMAGVNENVNELAGSVGLSSKPKIFGKCGATISPIDGQLNLRPLRKPLGKLAANQNMSTPESGQPL